MSSNLEIPSLLGPVPVLQGRAVDRQLRREGSLGSYDGTERTIRVRSDLSEGNLYQVLGHEMFHMMLNDSGVDNLLPSKMEEAVCDVFGTWFSHALRNGLIEKLAKR